MPGYMFIIIKWFGLNARSCGPTLLYLVIGFQMDD